MALPEAGNRKRHRNTREDEISEFTPLSKRINNLHINNSFFPFVKLQQPLEELKPDMHRAMMNGRLADFDGGSSRNIDSALEADLGWAVRCYNPDLTPAENPYYYESNRLLYELYLERSQRSHLPSPNDHF